jgi:multiple sugar transport system permease protein
MPAGAPTSIESGLTGCEAARPWWRPGRGAMQQWHGWAFLAPSLGLLAAFAIYPLISALWLSLHERHIFSRDSTFVGLANFTELAGSDAFWSAVVNSFVFSIATVVLQLVVGIATALMLHRRFAGRAFVRGLVLFPLVLPTIVAVLIWKWMLNDLYGVVNTMLAALGITDQPPVWLGAPGVAMATVIVLNVWMFFPFVTVNVLARLQMIAADLLEAARVDGAGAIQRFRHVVLPELWSTIGLVLVIRSIWMFNKFDSVWLLTGGGPLGTTETLPLLAYRRAFSDYELGMGAAVSTAIFLILAALAWIYARLLQTDMR